MHRRLLVLLPLLPFAFALPPATRSRRGVAPPATEADCADQGGQWAKNACQNPDRDAAPLDVPSGSSDSSSGGGRSEQELACNAEGGDWNRSSCTALNGHTLFIMSDFSTTIFSANVCLDLSKIWVNGSCQAPTAANPANGPWFIRTPISNASISGMSANGVNCFVPGFETSHNLTNPVITNMLTYIAYATRYPSDPTDTFTVVYSQGCDPTNLYSLPIDYPGTALPAAMQAVIGDSTKAKDPVTADIVLFSSSNSRVQYCAVLTNANASEKYEQCNDI